MKVIVLGIGSMGSAACDHLARSGAEVLGLDQFEVPHQQGSHHGSSRMIRQSYYEHPDYVPLLLRAYELWKNLEQRSGRRIFEPTGGLYLAARDADIIRGSLRSAREHDLPHQLLDHARIETMFPQFSVPGSFRGFMEEQAGIIRPEAAIEAHLSEATKSGAQLLQRQRVESIKTSDSGVEVQTAEGKHFGDRLVVTSGAWTTKLLPDQGMPIVTTRQVQAWFRPTRNPDQFESGRFPSWFIETDSPWGHYGFPLEPRSGCLKIALHRPGAIVDPDDPSWREIPTDEIEAFHACLSKFIPDAAGDFAEAKACLYSNTPDQHFIVGSAPGQPNCFLSAGFSGHGFKFASVIGEILAGLALTGKSHQPIALFDPTRFN